MFSCTLDTDMVELDQLIQAQLHSDASLVMQVGMHIIQAGGKRIRPRLVMLIARALGYEGAQHHVLAAIVEFIHTASLLHDDVVDRSGRRRGVESANARFGNAEAVLVGDFMHTRAFQMMLSLNSMPVMEVLAAATNTIAEGELLQLMKSRSADLDEAGYFGIIYAKTARLFEAAAELGVRIDPSFAHFAETAALYGRSLGMAFQLTDDCLDYAGDAAELGKDTGNDLREGKMTLPLIWLMQNGKPHEKEQIRAYMENGERSYFEGILRAVRHGEALRYTAGKAAAAAAEAALAIESFPESRYKDCLRNLCHFAVERNY
jgi:octaprenyl-diphosphate synthase